jgi:hypothetical protein
MVIVLKSGWDAGLRVPDRFKPLLLFKGIVKYSTAELVDLRLTRRVDEAVKDERILAAESLSCDGDCLPEVSFETVRDFRADVRRRSAASEV